MSFFSLEIKVHCGWLCVTLCDAVLIVQDNIQDKLRGIPIELCVDIQDAKRKRRQSSPSQLLPVLDAAEPMTTRSMVCVHGT